MPAPADAALQEWYELWDTDEGVLVGMFDEEDPALAVVRDAVARFGARSKRVARYGLLRWAGRRKGSRRGARATLLVEAPELAKRAMAAVQETGTGPRGRRSGPGNR
jgi:hypothetical protein